MGNEPSLVHRPAAQLSSTNPRAFSWFDWISRTSRHHEGQFPARVTDSDESLFHAKHWLQVIVLYQHRRICDSASNRPSLPLVSGQAGAPRHPTIPWLAAQRSPVGQRHWIVQPQKLSILKHDIRFASRRICLSVNRTCVVPAYIPCCFSKSRIHRRFPRRHLHLPRGEATPETYHSSTGSVVEHESSLSR